MRCCGCLFRLSVCLSSIVGLLATSSAGAADPVSLVERALQAEVDGAPTQRKSLLDQALRIDADCAPARWQAGFVATADGWMTVEGAQSSACENPRLAEYRQLVHLHSQTAQGQHQLALFCRKQGFRDRESFHWRQLIGYAPNHKQAMRALGLKVYKNRLLTDEQIEVFKRIEKEYDENKKRWRGSLAEIRRDFESGDSALRDEALRRLQTISDASVVPFIESAFAGADAELQNEAVTLLDETQDHIATLALLRFAVLADDPDLRVRAATALRSRPWHSFVPLLMGALETPVQLSYNITTLGPGRAYAYISLFREGTQADFQLSMTWTLRQVLQVDDRRTSPRIGAMSAMMWQMVLARIYRSMNSFIGTASRSAGQLSATVARSNADMQAWNSRIFDVLRTSTHAQFEDDIHACWDWWREYNELAPGGEKPLVTQAGRVGREEKYRTVFISQSCFTPGTMVWAETGPRKIEQVQIGDRVLSQDLETGELAYKLVVNTTVRPPSDILRVQAGDSEVFTTLGHPFWVVGEGWRMAKQLKPGDRIHTVDGALVVDDIVQGVPSLAHNLIVEDFRTYFVGANRLLVHDNGVRMPTKALVPGLSGERLH